MNGAEPKGQVPCHPHSVVDPQLSVLLLLRRLRRPPGVVFDYRFPRRARGPDEGRLVGVFPRMRGAQRFGCPSVRVECDDRAVAHLRRRYQSVAGHGDDQSGRQRARLAVVFSGVHATAFLARLTALRTSGVDWCRLEAAAGRLLSPVAIVATAVSTAIL